MVQKTVVLALALLVALSTALYAAGGRSRPQGGREGHADFLDLQRAAQGVLSGPAGLLEREFPQKPLAITMEEYPNQEMHNKLLLSLQSGSARPTSWTSTSTTSPTS